MKKDLTLYTVDQLKAMAKERGLRGYSKLKKQELIDLLSDTELSKEAAEEGFLVATDKDIEIFERAMKENVVIEKGTAWYSYWKNLGFAIEKNDGSIEIPQNVQESYAQLWKDQAFMAKRERMMMLTRYIQAAVNLYDVIDAEKLAEIINQVAKLQKAATKEELIAWCQLWERQRGCQLFCTKDGYIMDELFGDNILGVTEDYHRLLEVQKNKPFYIPKQEEFLKYEDTTYVDENDSFNALKTFMISEMAMDEEKAKEVCAEVQLYIRNGAMPGDTIDECTRLGVTFKDDDQVSAFTQQLMNMYNTTRIPDNRGYTAEEVRDMAQEKETISPEVFAKLKQIGFPVENILGQQMVSDFAVKNKKVYPNDSCPCGSGKKYKKCCGR